MNAFDPGSYGAETRQSRACSTCGAYPFFGSAAPGECPFCAEEPPEPSRLVQAAVWVGVGVCIALCVGRAVWKGVRG